MSKFISIEEAVKLIPDGASVMFGGFMGCGNAHKFIDALSKSGVKDLTMICNDGSMPGGFMGEDYYGVAKLIHNKQVKKLIATHVGLNPEVGIQSFDGTLETILVPQGSFVEMIRAGGAGLGGVLTPTGVGTIIEDSPYCLGKQNIQGRDYLLMAPLKADFAVIAGAKIDKAAVKVLPIFDLIAAWGNVPERDMFNTYNMGVGMSVIVPAEQKDLALEILRANGEDAYVIGEIIEGNDSVILN